MPSFAAEPNAQARTVVQWFRDCGCRNVDIVTRTGLTGDFVYRWTKREDTDILPGRGPAPIISDHQADELVKAVLKLRFHSADALRSDIVNPDTGKMVCRQTVCDALEYSGARRRSLQACVQKGQMLTLSQKQRRFIWCKEQKRKKAKFRAPQRAPRAVQYAFGFT